MVNGFRTTNWSWLAVVALAAPFTIHHLPFTAAAAEPQPIDTEVIVRVVGHGSMQRGESGDQNQIMHTPRIMEEPQYSSRPSASFHATLPLQKPTVVEIAALGPLAYPEATRRVST